MRTKSLLGLVAVLAVGGVIAIVVWYDPSPPAQRAAASDEAETEESQEPATIEAAPQPEFAQAPEPLQTPPVVTATATAAAAPATLPGEDALMAKLHALSQSDPEQSIQLAREGNRRFPKGSGASERAWIICKSLTNLARFDEAREEAQKMVKDYPGTSWTMDVVKHILIQPGTHPSQRGYGRQLQGE